MISKRVKLRILVAGRDNMTETLASLDLAAPLPTATHATAKLQPGIPPRWIALTVLLDLAAITRPALLGVIQHDTNGREFNDDFYFYQLMLQKPLALLTGGDGIEEMGAGGIYAPLIPFHLMVPGKALMHWFGWFVGQRLAMI